MSQSPLAKALRQFEAAEANLVKLERLWDQAEDLIAQGIVFGDNPEYEATCRSIDLIMQHLPKIDGWKPNIEPLELNAIAQNRFDAQEFGEPEAIIFVESAITEPAKHIREYRFRFSILWNEIRRPDGPQDSSHIPRYDLPGSSSPAT